MNFWKPTTIVLLGILLGTAGMMVYDRQQTPALSGTSSNPGVSAIFETSLAAPIGISDTTMTLASAAIIGTVTLPSGYTCFTLDSGTSITEYVCGTVSGTSVTGMLRGVSPVTGTTTVASLAFAHRRGADVKITDWPTLGIVNNQLNGRETVPNLLSYDDKVLIVTGSPTTTLATKYYVDNSVVSGAPNADTVTKGIVQIATAKQAASSTSLGTTGAADVLWSAYATDTPQACANTANGGCVAMTQLGKNTLRQTFLNLTEYFAFTGGVFSTNSTTTNATTTSQLGWGNIAMLVPTFAPSASGTVPTLSATSPFQITFQPQTTLDGVATTTPQAMAYATTSVSRTGDIHLSIFMPALVTNDQVCLILNNDRAADYGWSYYQNYVKLGNSTGENALVLYASAATTTTTALFDIHIMNQATSRKMVTWTAAMSSGTNIYPINITGSGVWSNTSNPITSIAISSGNNSVSTCGQTNTIPSGTIIRVYGQ